MPEKPAKVPPARVVRLIESARTALQKVNRAMVPGNVALLETVQGAWVTQALYVAAKLGIADELAHGPKTADEVAAKVGAHPDSVFRLMRMLAGRVVFSQRPGRPVRAGRYGSGVARRRPRFPAADGPVHRIS